MGRRVRRYITVAPPYRLDLTVTALRRLSTNVVDILSPDGAYLRVLQSRRGGRVRIRLWQTRPDTLAVELWGTRSEAVRTRTIALLRRMLGVDEDLAPFYRAAHRFPWLRPLLNLGQGVRPPRYPTLWEACVKVILFQQISLQAASTITRRMVEALGEPFEIDGMRLYAFPDEDRVLDASEKELRSFGISPNKLATLRRVGEAIGTGALDAGVLEEAPSPDAVRVLEAIKGIGPWSATVILLRGFGRLDVFPMNDTSVTKNLELVGATTRLSLPELMEGLGPQRGMLYYYLLLARLDSRGQLAVPSTDPGDG